MNDETQPGRDDAATPPPIEQQREELAETVDALAAKLDVPARVNAAASETARSAKTKAAENRTALFGVAVAAVVGTAAIVVARRRR
ncbi:DUF3618 domain-containing protein [Gordonia aurantiaca]|uniref:DUF3618 domain-containing protein n=1 Tax=Gordonia sp. B21 TaxID=3151852 RepID=UPI00326442A3